jgi:hypothetical protein
MLIPLACKAFEPLNTDDAGTVVKGLNQIEQYFFTTASHGGGSANPADVITPGEEYFGGQGAKASLLHTPVALQMMSKYLLALPTLHPQGAAFRPYLIR